MKSIFFVMLVVATLIGCTIQFHKPGTQESAVPVPTDSAKVEKPKEEITPPKPWPEEEKRFWIAMYFTRLSYDPNVRVKFLPFWLHRVAKCIIDKSEVIYEFEYWRDNIGNMPKNINPISLVTGLVHSVIPLKNINPIDGQNTYRITYECANKHGEEQQKELLEKMKEAGPSLEDSV